MKKGKGRKKETERKRERRKERNEERKKEVDKPETDLSHDNLCIGCIKFA